MLIRGPRPGLPEMVGRRIKRDEAMNLCQEKFWKGCIVITGLIMFYSDMIFPMSSSNNGRRRTMVRTDGPSNHGTNFEKTLCVTIE